MTKLCHKVNVAKIVDSDFAGYFAVGSVLVVMNGWECIRIAMTCLITVQRCKLHMHI
jgi:hypothetical protein